MILKICGITNPEDAAAAVAAGASAIGFNFYRRSPRYTEPERAAEIRTPVHVLRVGVFVNEPRAHVEAIVRTASLDIAQLHGDERAEEYPATAGVWKAVRVTPGFDFTPYETCPAEAILLDGPAAHLYGGAGIAFDWTVAASLRKRFVLAGGLDASNVGRAVELAHPWGVDACSKIESSPGIKDHQKMRAFLQAAAEALRV